MRTALAPHVASFGRKVDLDALALIVANMVDALVHAVVVRRPRTLAGKGKSKILQRNSGLSCAELMEAFAAEPLKRHHAVFAR